MITNKLFYLHLYTYIIIFILILSKLNQVKNYYNQDLISLSNHYQFLQSFFFSRLQEENAEQENH